MTTPVDTRGERALLAAVLRLAVADALAGQADAAQFLRDFARFAPFCEALDLDPHWFQARLQQQHPALFAAPPPADPARLLADWRQRVVWLARQCWTPGHHGLSQEDLVQEGVIGLLDALTKYDATRDTTFATYAAFRITGAMRDALRAADPLPRSVRDYQRAARQAEQTVAQQLGRAPERAEVAAVLGMASETYDRWQCTLVQLHTLSLDYDYAPEHYRLTPDDRKPSGVTTLHSFLAAPEAEHWDPVFQANVRTAVAQLSAQAQLVLRLYYEEELSLKTIGDRLGVSESRISQLRIHACGLLARRLASPRRRGLPLPPSLPQRLAYNGEERTIAEWAQLYGLLPGTLRTRLLRGGTWPQVLLAPVRPKKKEG